MAGPQHLQAPDAQCLMRSRYSAFVGEQADYLRQTWHPSTRPAALDFEPGLRWLGLQLLNHLVPDDHHASVEFVARSKLRGRARRLHEISRFVREDGRWFYLDGQLRS
jgi:SEC-C motif-containing protein